VARGLDGQDIQLPHGSRRETNHPQGEHLRTFSCQSGGQRRETMTKNQKIGLCITLIILGMAGTWGYKRVELFLLQDKIMTRLEPLLEGIKEGGVSIKYQTAIKVWAQKGAIVDGNTLGIEQLRLVGWLKEKGLTVPISSYKINRIEFHEKGSGMVAVAFVEIDNVEASMLIEDGQEIRWAP
jgi:hypothetical protein